MKKETFGAEEIYLAPETTNEVHVSNETPLAETVETEEQPMAKNPKDKIRVGELLELRRENRKVFKMSDGSEQAVFYPETVNVLNKETGLFEPVDTTLCEEEGGKCLVNRKNNFVAKFSREEENDDLFSIESGMHKVTVSAKKTLKNKNKGVIPSVRKKEKDDARKIDIVSYSNVENGADYEYSVQGGGVKEEIVIKEKSSVYRYPFVMTCENVTPKLEENSTRVAFLSNETGEEIFFIPAPFMTDANGTTSHKVRYVMRKGNNEEVYFSVTADSEWINAEERAFPVVIDPQIQLSGNSAMSTYSWESGNLYSASLHKVGTTECCEGACTVNRMYMSFKMPTLPRNPRIKKAELKFYQYNGSGLLGAKPMIGLYYVDDNIGTGTCTPYHEPNLIDFAKMQIDNSKMVSYTFDVTSLVDQVNNGEIGIKNLVLKMIDETAESDNSITLYGSAYSGTYAPQFIITYESSYGVNTSYRTHTHDLGRFGQGSIDLQRCNLMLESEDFAWAGNRMPVTIKHLYNSALSDYQYTENNSIKLHTADFSGMKLGNGFKLNVMQSMKRIDSLPISWTEDELKNEEMSFDGYIYIGENGEETYFKQSNEKKCCCSDHCYYLYKDVESSEMVYDYYTRTLTQGDEKRIFDESGRLIQIQDAYNTMQINYDSAGQLVSVVDGAGRSFEFDYTNGFLTAIIAPDNTKITYTYSGNLLETVTYPDGTKAVITNSYNRPRTISLLDASGKTVYKVVYDFYDNLYYSVKEYGEDEAEGVETTFHYSASSGRTIVETTEPKDTDEGETADNVIKTVYMFNDDGEIVSEYVYSEDTGNVGANGEESGIHPHSGDGGARVVSNINNLLLDHNFKWLDNWCGLSSNCDDFRITRYVNEQNAKFGNKLLRMESNTEEYAENGVYQVTNMLPAGQYTFSVYMRVISSLSGENSGAYIRVTKTNGEVLAESEHITRRDSEFIRLVAPFELTSAQSVQVQIIVCGKGVVHTDAAQLENNAFANAYNMLVDGNFELGSGWELNGASYTTGTRFNMQRSLCMTGSLDKTRRAWQKIDVKSNRSTRETFTLSGWAKGYGLPAHEREGVNTPTFRLRAVMKYHDTDYNEFGTEEYVADFSPCTEDWQLASVEIAKSKYRRVDYIEVYLEYDHNFGMVYFDDIQLVRNSIETGLSSADFEPEEQTTQATATKAEPVTETETETQEDTGFKERIDQYGNALTETTFTDGEFGTIYRSFKFNEENECCPGDNVGNDLVEETDARGNTTKYTVNPDNSRNEEVVDRCGNKTVYEYDAAGRITKVTNEIYEVETEEAKNPTVSYKYDSFDNMTEIARGDGMKYQLKYNAFHNLESIGIEGKTDGDLIKYTYKNGNGRLKEMAYANGDKMKATYNSIGQMIAEKWYNYRNTLTAHYKYVYDGQGNIVRSVDILGKKEYNYLYEDGKIMQSTESDITVDAATDIVTSKSFVCSVRYYYNGEGALTKKRIKFADGKEQTVTCEQAENESQIVRFMAGEKTITSHSKTDSFGRKTFDELQLGTGFVSRQFHYLEGEKTQEHTQNGMLKSMPTTQLVSQIVLSNGLTLSYGYDEEERITSVTETRMVNGEPTSSTTLYTYDALGQLLTEKKDGVIVNEMTYDNYGNIASKNGVSYMYGIPLHYTPAFKDQLIGFDDNPLIIYDEQGNPLGDTIYTYIWEKGRQLKECYDDKYDITYTYNANGIRTSKFVWSIDGSLKYDYVLDGAKILRETCNGNVLIPLYDNEDSVCGIEYNGSAYYFLKNLQGDVIAIVNYEGEEVARYSYDAWGVCTVTMDNSGCNIANINPFRYRSYYFDKETGLYYLQSRYYDPEVGRFINADDAGYLMNQNGSTHHNLFSYCHNNPVNHTDFNGYIIWSTIFKFVLGLIFGLFIQFFSDVVSYIFSLLFYKGKATFTPYMGDYLGTMLEYGFQFVSPFGAKKKKAILQICSVALPRVAKYGVKLLRREPITLADILSEVLSIIIAIIIDCFLGVKKKNEISKIKKLPGARNKKKYRQAVSAIRVKYRKWGANIDFVISIPTFFFNALISAITN